MEVREGDLTDSASLGDALRGCRTLFHAAADYRMWTRHPEAMFRANVDGTRDLVLAAAEAGVERIVYTSSVATLGLPHDGGDGDENTPVRFEDMIGPYKQSKYRAEEEVLKLVSERGLPVVIVNPSLPVGPGDIKPTPTGRMILEAAMGRMPIYVDTGLNVVHVDDVAEGHFLAWEKGRVGERYVLGGENMTLRQILEAMASLTGKGRPLFGIPHGVVLPIAHAAELWTRLTGGEEPFVSVDGVRLARKKMFFSTAKAEHELGYRFRPAREALSDALSWYREHGYLN